MQLFREKAQASPILCHLSPHLTDFSWNIHITFSVSIPTISFAVWLGISLFPWSNLLIIKRGNRARCYFVMLNLYNGKRCHFLLFNIRPIFIIKILPLFTFPSASQWCGWRYIYFDRRIEVVDIQVTGDKWFTLFLLLAIICSSPFDDMWRRRDSMMCIFGAKTQASNLLSFRSSSAAVSLNISDYSKFNLV